MAAVLILGSCSSNTVVYLQTDLAGEATIDLEVSPVLVSYYQDITGDYESESIVSGAVVSQQLAERPGINLESFIDLNARQKRIQINFDDVNALVRQESGNQQLNLIDFRQASVGQSTLRLLLNEDTIPALLSLGPISSNILSDYLLPQSGQTTSARQYREDLLWALGDYLDVNELGELIDASMISIVFVLPNEPRVVRGGRTLSSLEADELGISPKYGVEFSMNIVELLTLSTQEDFFVQY